MSKIKIDLSNPEDAATFEAAQRAEAEVESWPAWKRGTIGLTLSRVGEIHALLEDTRHELSGILDEVCDAYPKGVVGVRWIEAMLKVGRYTFSARMRLQDLACNYSRFEVISSCYPKPARHGPRISTGPGMTLDRVTQIAAHLAGVHLVLIKAEVEVAATVTKTASARWRNALAKARRHLTTARAALEGLATKQHGRDAAMAACTAEEVRVAQGHDPSV